MRTFLRTILAVLMPLVFAASVSRAADLPRTELRMAFPSVGALISNQVGTILQNTDLFKQHGFDAKITPLPLGRELKVALVSGQVDVILTSEANFIVLLGEGYDCYAISSLGTGGRMALVVKKDSKIQSIAELRGKQVATIFGTSLHQPAVEWLSRDGLKPGQDVQLLNMRGMGPMNSAFASGDISAMVTFDPFLLDGLKKNEYRMLEKTDMDLIVVMSAAYANKHPGVIQAFNATLKEAAFYMATHKSQANQWASTLSGTSVASLDEGSKFNANYRATTLAGVSIGISKRFRHKLAQSGEFLFREKLINKKVQVDNYIRDLQ